MKKQLLAAAVAATMASVASADISITGNAKFEYTSTDTTASSNHADKTNTEVNLGIKGQNGGTAVVANLEFNTHGDVNNGSVSNVLDVEDLYMTTSIGDVAIKAGNYASGTSGLLGEIDEGGRSSNKVDISTKVGDAKISYAVSSASGTGASLLDSDGASVSVSMPIAGFNVAIKEQSDSYTGFGISGDVGGVGVRLEQKNSDSANSDVNFGNLTTSVNGIDLGLAWIDADATGLVTESDSSIFAVEMSTATAGTADTGVDGVTQLMAKTSMSGNTVTVKAGEVSGSAGYHDADYMQVNVARALASGATANITYTDKEDRSVATSSSLTDTQVFEIDLSVKF